MADAVDQLKIYLHDVDIRDTMLMKKLNDFF